MRTFSVILFAALAVSLSAQETLRGRFDTSRGFTPLFDGKSLDGWVTKGGRYDGAAIWKVEDGAIVGREGENHAGGLLYTALTYKNFIFAADVRLDYPFDSGVFVRMAKEGKGAQVTLDYRDDGEIGAIYADGFLKHNETAKAKWRKGEWNRVEVRCVGDDLRLTAWLNGEEIVDFQMEAGAKGYAPTGLIGVQVHGNRNDPPGLAAKFKNLFVRELPDFDPKVFTCEDDGTLLLKGEAHAAGWRPLFNGRDLEQWEIRGDEAGAVIRDGLIAFAHGHDGGEMRTVEDFQDFDLTLEFKILKMANSGVFLRADRKQGNPAFSGCEVQILDDFNWESVTKSKLKEWQFTGSLYGSVANKERSAFRPLGSWNKYDISFKGSKLKVLLNGKTLYDVDTTTVPLLSGEAKPFAERAKSGYIGLQMHAPAEAAKPEYAFFRNIFVKRWEVK